MSADGPEKPNLKPEHLKAIAAAIESRASPNPTTLLSLIRHWRSASPNRPSSPEWERLSLNTKKTWGSALDRIEEKWGSIPLSVFNDPRMVARVVAWRDSRAATPRAADIGVTVLKQLLEFGRLRGKVAINVADKIPRLYRGANRAEIIWTDEEIERAAEVARERDLVCVADAIRLASLTGLRCEDLSTLTWRGVGEFAIAKKALKVSRGKRRHATIPRIPQLDELLGELRTRPRMNDVDTVLVDRKGGAWSGVRLSKAVGQIRDAANVVHVDEDTGETRNKHLHDLRGTFATRLMTGTTLTDAEIADVMGWSAEEVGRIRRVYVDQSAVIVALGERIRRGAV